MQESAFLLLRSSSSLTDLLENENNTNNLICHMYTPHSDRVYRLITDNDLSIRACTR